MLKLYNTYSKKKEIFKPLKRGRVLMYNCGPTVYDYAHIGNFSAYLMADFLRRYLEDQGYKVKQVMNITDAGHLTGDTDTGEDKIAKKAKAQKKTPDEITKFYIQAFLDDWKKLNMLEPARRPWATKYIKEMIAFNKELLEKDFAYEIDGTIYFNISKFDRYGQLSGNTADKLKREVRAEIKSDKNKKNPGDFVLWFRAPKNHLLQWDSPWGRGYPGWHIECSAMSKKLLGTTIDIHTGGEDNIFPHHENEIAQSEAASGKTFARYWLHKRHIFVGGEKMSKSKGNFYTLSDLEKKDIHPLAFRMLMFASHYRQKVNYSDKSIAQAQTSIDKMMELLDRLQEVADNPLNIKSEITDTAKLIRDTKKDFDRALDDDLNTPQALAVVLNFVRTANQLIDQSRVGREESKSLIDFIFKLFNGGFNFGKHHGHTFGNFSIFYSVRNKCKIITSRRNF